jgi:hypothetical protein
MCLGHVGEMFFLGAFWGLQCGYHGKLFTKKYDEATFWGGGGGGRERVKGV